VAKEVEYKIGPVIGIGRNKTLARENAEQQAEKMLSGAYMPRYMYWRGTITVFTREPQQGWSYRIIWPDQEVTLRNDGTKRFSEDHLETTYCTNYGYNQDNLDDTILQAKFHVAQSMWVASDGPSPDLETRLFLKTDENIAAFEHNCMWLWKHKQAEMYGLTNEWCRIWANTHSQYETLGDFLHKYQWEIKQDERKASAIR